jgi:hypothetical protein
MTVVSRLLVVLVLSVLALPAHAAFGDCNKPEYLIRFDSRLAGSSDFFCQESARVPVRSSEGPTHIRMIEHFDSDWARRPGATQAFKNGIDGAVRAMPKLGEFSIPDVTIMLMAGFEPPTIDPNLKKKEDFGHIAAVTEFLKKDDECHITFYLLGLGATADYAAAVVAHELFHCIEAQSLTQAQMSTGNFGLPGGGTWWIEGAADWFSTLAVRTPDYLQERVVVFDKASPTFALNDMAYEAYVFFAWLGGKKTPRAVLPFLRHMAATTGTAAQRRAMMAAMPQDDWHEFAQDYFDQTISDGQGASIGSTPVFKKTIEWTRTHTENTTLKPFVLMRAKLRFNCGRWGVTVRPSDRYTARKDEGRHPWLGVPDVVDVEEGEAKQYLFAAMPASVADIAASVVGNVQQACEGCASVPDIDQCLVGTWEMTVDGVIRWAQRQMPAGARVSGAGLAGSRWAFADDSTYRLDQAPARVGLHMPDQDYRGTGRISGPINGRWSAAGGTLNLCPTTRGLTGTATTSSGRISQTSPMQVGSLMQRASRSYSCSGNRMTMTSPMPVGGSATWEFRKL